MSHSISIAPVAYSLSADDDDEPVPAFRPRRIGARVTTGFFVGAAGVVLGVFVGLALAGQTDTSEATKPRLAHQVAGHPRPLELLSPANAPAKKTLVTALRRTTATTLAPRSAAAAPAAPAAATTARPSAQDAADLQLLHAAQLERPL